MNDQTTPLAPDEKLCPFCAEVIKAAAIKCRFCHSDLTVPDAAADAGPAPVSPAKTTAPAPEPVEVTGGAGTPGPEDEPEGEPESEAAGPDPVPVPLPEPGPADASLTVAAPTSRMVLVGLVVLCLALAGGLWFLVHRAQHPHLDTAPNGQVTSNSFRNAAMSAASDAAGKALSYSYKTFDADRAQARALMGAKLAKQYDAAMDQVKAQTASAKLTLKATVLSAGLVSAEEHEAKVLLFVNTVTTTEGSKKQQFDQNRVLMTLTRKDGGWIVSKMDAF